VPVFDISAFMEFVRELRFYGNALDFRRTCASCMIHFEGKKFLSDSGIAKIFFADANIRYGLPSLDIVVTCWHPNVSFIVRFSPSREFIRDGKRCTK